MVFQMPSDHKTIGVIGLGSIGMRHAKNLIAMGHKVIGYDPDMSRRMELGGILYEPHEIFDDQIVDGLVIASPTKLHLPHLADAAGIGVPIFVEKPISDRNPTSVLEAMYVAHEASSPIMVGTNLRFHSCVKKAKEWLEQGLIGKPLWASFCVAQHNTKYTDPVILNWGAHECDLALYLLGPATVTAAAGNDQIMDVCLLHEYGVPSTVHMDYVTEPEIRFHTVTGTRGTIEIDICARYIGIRSGHGKGYFKDWLDLSDTSFDTDYIEEMQAFIDLIDGKPVPHAATGADGLACLELILEAQRIANASV